MGNQSSSGGLNYALGEVIAEFPPKDINHEYPWKMHLGTSLKKKDQQVSIFRFDKKTHSSYVNAASNALRRCKTLRHPYTLSYLDGVDLDTEIIIVTEPVKPLYVFLKELSEEDENGFVLSEEAKYNAIAWGLMNIAEALSFLNNTCKLIHGNVSMASIFVTPGGDWKLGGYDVTEEYKENSAPDLMRQFQYIPHARYKSPERLKNDWGNMGVSEYGNPAWSTDAWGFGCVLYEAFTDGRTASASDLLNISMIPEPLRGAYKKLLSSNPRDRIDPGTISKFQGAGPFFGTTFVKCLNFFDELQLKDNAQKERFFKIMLEKSKTFPHGAIRFKIIPKIMDAIRIHANAVNAANAAGGVPQPGVEAPSANLSSLMLNLILVLSDILDGTNSNSANINGDLSNHNSNNANNNNNNNNNIGKNRSAREEFTTPAIVELFGCNDRATRVALLQKMENFSGFLQPDIVNEKIFDKVCTGFSDSTPVLRELTIKSMMYLAPKLSTTNLNENLMRFFAKLQTDPEPAIRTNTTICLGKIAHLLTAATRARILIPAYGRALRDPFIPARIAGLKAMTASQDYLKGDIPGIATKVLPQICPMLVDPSLEVQTTAFKTMNVMMKILEDAHNVHLASAAANPNNNNNTNTINNSNNIASTAGGIANLPRKASSEQLNETGLLGKVAGWASGYNSATQVQNQNRIGEIPKPVTSYGSGAPKTIETKNLISLKPSTTSKNDDDDDGWGDDDDLDNDEDSLFKNRSSNKTSSSINSTSTSTKQDIKPNSGMSIGGAKKLSLAPKSSSNTGDLLDLEGDWGKDSSLDDLDVFASIKSTTTTSKSDSGSSKLKPTNNNSSSSSKLVVPTIKPLSSNSTKPASTSSASLGNSEDFFAMALQSDNTLGSEDRSSAEARRQEAERLKEEARKRRAERAAMKKP